MPEHRDPLCIADMCGTRAQIADPVPLCQRHVFQVVSAAFPLVMNAAAPAFGAIATEGERVDAGALMGNGQHEPIVYFIRNGDRVKIGTTRNLRTRVSTLSLRPEDVLLALPGDSAVEAKIHDQFRELRTSTTEWFKNGPELERFIAAHSAQPAIAPARRPAEEIATARRVDRRQRLVFEIVAEAGPQGLRPDDVLQQMRARFPETDPPHVTVIARWLGRDARIHRPVYGRYAVV